jgi:hypothetical protein
LAYVDFAKVVDKAVFAIAAARVKPKLTGKGIEFLQLVTVN